MSTRLRPETYLDHLRADGDRLSALARSTDLATPVPTCPGWTLGDLVAHCAEVYGHKRSVLRLGHATDERGDAVTGAAVVDAHDERLAALIGDLERIGPDAQTWTWFPGETSTGFWFRRMAQEALVHRVDGELGELPDDGHVVREVDPMDQEVATYATIRGAAPDVDLMLWGRPTSEPVAESGDHDVLERLFSRLHLAVSD